MTRARDRRESPEERAQHRIERLLAEAGHVSVPRPGRNRMCDGKTQYGERLARIVAQERTAELGEAFVAYACVYCPAYHVGHRDSDYYRARRAPRTA